MKNLIWSRFTLLPLFLIVVFFNSCNSFYATSLPYQARLEGQGDIHTSVNGGAGGFNVGVSFSPLNHLYVGGVTHAYVKGYGHHFSGGPILGFYHNGRDNNFHANIMGSYQWGDVLFSHTKLQGFGAYQSLQGQLFISQRVGKRKIRNVSLSLNAGTVDFNFSRMHYTYNGPDSLYTTAAIGSITFQLERQTPNFLPGFAYYWQVGLSGSPSDFANYSEFYIYHGVVLRAGISYRFNPFRKKST